MPFTTSIGNAILNKLLKGTDFTDPTDWDISLHTGDPGQNGANEVSGGSYARQEPSFDTVASKEVTTDADIEFTSMPSCTVTHLGLWGYIGSTWTFIWGGALDSSKAVGAGDTAKIGAGNLDAVLT